MNAGADDSGAKAASDDAQHDLGLAGTLPAPEVSADGPPRPDPSLYDIADAAERDRVFEARSHYQDMLAAFERAWGPDDLHVAHALVGLTIIALQRRELAVAREHAERAVAIRESGDASPELLAEALWDDLEQRRRARVLAQMAHDEYTRLGVGGKRGADATLVWLEQHQTP